MFLVEKLPAETPRDVEAFLEVLVREIYHGRPEWLEYNLRESYRFQDREFIRMSCTAGSVHARLSQRASTGEGIGRDILELGARDDWPRAWLLHRGQQSEHDPSEVEAIGQQVAAHEPPLPDSGLSAPAHRTLDSLPAPGSGGGR